MANPPNTYDAITGADQAAVNGMLAQIYGALYPSIFSGSVAVGKDDVVSIGYDISAVPVVAFDGIVFPTQRDVASFALSFPAISVSVALAGGASQNGTGSMKGRADAEVNVYGVLRFRITELAILIPEDPALTELVNQYLIEPLIHLLNIELLGGIMIPPIDWEGVKMSPGPVVTADNGVLLIYSALAPDNPTQYGTSGPWPEGKPFTMADEKLVDRIADAFLKEYASFEYETSPITIPVYFCNLKLSAVTKVEVSSEEVDIRPGSGDRVRAVLKAKGQSGIKAKCSGFDETFGLELEAQADVTMVAWIDDKQVKLRVESINSLYITKVNWIEVPSELDQYLDKILGWLEKPFLSSVNQFLKTLDFTVYSIPEIKLHIGGIEFEIQIENGSLDQVEGPQRKALLAGSATATLTADVSRVAEVAQAAVRA